MRTTLVLNAKGGSGKTTIATNLAGYFAAAGQSVVLQDYDAQGSAMDWLAQRTFQMSQIHGQEHYKAGSQYMTRAWQFRLPAHTDHVIIDTPAAVELQKHVTMIRSADRILVPVSPSAIEIRATLTFIAELQDFIKLYNCQAALAVVANKVDLKSQAYILMQQKFRAVNVEFIANLSMHESYYVAAETGVSIFEINHPLLARDQHEWEPLVSWIEGKQIETDLPASKLYAVAD